MTITKPVDLIVATTMHEALRAVKEFEMVKGLFSKIGKIDTETLPDVNAEIARKLLCAIAHDAHISKVYEALKAVGAPATGDRAIGQIHRGSRGVFPNFEIGIVEGLLALTYRRRMVGKHEVGWPCSHHPCIARSVDEDSGALIDAQTPLRQ